MTPRRPMLLAVALLVATAGRATAQPSACEDPDAPWRAPCPPAAATPQVLVAPAPAAPPPVRSLRDRTHNSIFPTGNTVRGGDVQFHMHELGLYNRAAFGVSDHLELSIGAPLIPLVVSAGARLAATPRDSRLRLVVGAGVWSPINSDAENAWQATVTAGYQADRLELHATVSRISPMEDGDQALTFVSAGFSYQTGAKFALIAELGRIAPMGGVSSGDCFDCSGGPPGIDGLLLGAKLMGERFDTDLGLMLIGNREERETITLPVVSMAYRY